MGPQRFRARRSEIPHAARWLFVNLRRGFDETLDDLDELLTGQEEELCDLESGSLVTEMSEGTPPRMFNRAFD